MPRKSAASMAASERSSPPTTTTHPSNANGDTSMLSEAHEQETPAKSKRGKRSSDTTGIDDLLLPRTLTSRLARGILPANTSIQKDAVLALTKSATVFISYLAAHANEQTTKKTINAQDVLKALHEIEMDGVMSIGKIGADGRIGGRLEREVEKYEGDVKGKRKGYRDKLKAKTDGDEGGDGDERGEPEMKRVRMEEDEDEAGDVGRAGSSSMPPPPQRLTLSLNGSHPNQPATNGETVNGHSFHPEDGDQTEDSTHDEDETQDLGDETVSEDDDVDEEEDDEQSLGEGGADLDAGDYGPDEQLRRDILINGEDIGESGGDESD